MCNVMRWRGANHLLKVTVVTEQHDVTNTQLWARERWLLLSPSLIHPLTRTHSRAVPSPTQTWFPWQLTNLPSEWSHSVWPRGMAGYDKWRYSIKAITCYCTVWWLSLFSLCLFPFCPLSPNFISHYPPFFSVLSFVYLPLIIPLFAHIIHNRFFLTRLLASSVRAHLVAISTSSSSLFLSLLPCCGGAVTCSRRWTEWGVPAPLVWDQTPTFTPLTETGIKRRFWMHLMRQVNLICAK